MPPYTKEVLSDFEVFPKLHVVKFFLNFLDDVRTEYLTFSSLWPVERGSALTAIQGFERGHLETSLVAIVIGEFGKWSTVLPFSAIG
jgi:hypothetical protein